MKGTETLTRKAVDRSFKALGARYFYESFYPPKRQLCYDNELVSRIFSVHYFNQDGEEIGYWIPDLAEWNGPHVFEKVRLWPEGFENQLDYLVV